MTGDDWRGIASMSLADNAARAFVESLGSAVDPSQPLRPGAVEGILDGAWLRVRTQQHPEAEIREYAIPADEVNLVVWISG